MRRVLVLVAADVIAARRHLLLPFRHRTPREGVGGADGTQQAAYNTREANESIGGRLATLHECRVERTYQALYMDML